MMKMEEWSLHQYRASGSDEGKRNKVVVGTWSLFLTGLVAILVFGCVIFIFRSDSRENNFDELVTTGGAVRRFINPVKENFKKCSTAQCKKLKKYILASMNETVDPCDNFYQYACGGWIKNNPIPTTSSTFSTFSKLNQKVEVILNNILRKKVSKKNKILKKVKYFYQSCMNQKAIDKKDNRPMLALIKYLHSWSLGGSKRWNKDTWNLHDVLLNIHSDFTSSGGPLFSVHVSDDPRHSSKHILEIDQAGPSLPREIYLNDTKTLKSYTVYLEEVAKLLDCKGDIKKQANETIEFERKLAKISVPDDVKQESWFRRMKLKDLEREVPDFPWFSYINKIFEGRATIDRNEDIIVPSLPYLKKMMTIVNTTSKEILSNYIVWSVIQDEVPYLSKKFLNARMRYKEKVLGSKGLRKRWKTCVSYTNEYLGEVLGKLYKKNHFKEEVKNAVEHMIKNIREAFKDNVGSLTWMDSQTKKSVEEKAAVMKDQVGYPPYIFNETRFAEKYKNLTILSDDLFQNRLNIIKFAHNRMLNKIRKKVDKEEWPMDPQTINAMYSFNQNGMIIPAGILQPPFFHGPNMSIAMLYGAIGSILGHELTHGFDNTGRKFNKHGELRKQWWTNSSLEAFKSRSQCMVDQYNSYKVRGKYAINGKLTLGENIADNGGFKTALRAYYDWLNNNQAEEQIIQGLDFTNDQLFHLSFAQAYCSNSRPKEQYLATLNDRHSEEEFRVIGTLSNSVEFAEAFNCELGSRMNPDVKCSVWVNEEAKS